MNEMRCVELANEMKEIISANTQAARDLMEERGGMLDRIKKDLGAAKQRWKSIKRAISFKRLIVAKVKGISADEARDMAQQYEQYAETTEQIVASEQELQETTELLFEAQASLNRREEIERRAEALLEALTMPE